jgi:hypothetical protein
MISWRWHICAKTCWDRIDDVTSWLTVHLLEKTSVFQQTSCFHPAHTHNTEINEQQHFECKNVTSLTDDLYQLFCKIQKSVMIQILSMRKEHPGWGNLRTGCCAEHYSLQGWGNRGLEKTAQCRTSWFVFLTKYYLGNQINQIKKKKMWHVWGRGRGTSFLLGELDQRRPLGSLTHRWEDTNKMDFKDTGWEGVEQTDLDRNTHKWY